MFFLFLSSWGHSQFNGAIRRESYEPVDHSSHGPSDYRRCLCHPSRHYTGQYPFGIGAGDPRLIQTHRQAAAETVARWSPQSKRQSKDSALGDSESGSDTGGKTKHERSKKAESAIVESLQPGAKVTSQRRSHSAKQRLEMTLIDEGKQIDRSDPRSANADSPRTETRDPASNATSARKGQPLKHSLAIISTDAGMQIDGSRKE
jgi:hypothetical protein